VIGRVAFFFGQIILLLLIWSVMCHIVEVKTLYSLREREEIEHFALIILLWFV